MQKPFKFFAIHKVSKEMRRFNIQELRPYQPSYISDEYYPWIIYEDIRYIAKVRLYNYINKIVPKKYRPFNGTEIGKSIPILF